MKRFLIVIAVILAILIVAFFAFNNYIYQEKQGEDVSTEEVPQSPVGEPVFEWIYTTAGDEQMPKLDIQLVARYPNGVEVRKEIDTVAGGCNDYPEPDDDVYENSTMVICYAAGLGQYYKVVEVEGQYEVKRKVFEETSPYYDPPVQEFETIVTF